MIIDPPDSSPSKNIYASHCTKVVLKAPYSGTNYSVILKPKTSLNTLYHIITKMELAKQNDNTVTFDYYYSIRRGKKIIMVAGMNIKALHMVSNIDLSKL